MKLYTFECETPSCGHSYVTAREDGPREIHECAPGGHVCCEACAKKDENDEWVCRDCRERMSHACAA